jgi:hypothetical protein
MLARAAVVFAVGVASLTWSFVFSPLAQAACHHFTVSASPASVSPGGTVNVTVSRDGAVAPSNVRVSSVDGTAKAPADYAKLDQDVRFTSDRSRSFTIKTVKDSAPDPAETFRLHLSSPGGCAVNPNYVLDPDVTVTIKATTGSPSRTPTPKPATHTQTPAALHQTNAPATSETTPSPSAPPTPTSTSSPPPTIGPQAGTKAKSRGLPAAAVAGIVLAGVAAAGAVGLTLYRRRAS